jgi:predicted nucleic acid-binding protein
MSEVVVVDTSIAVKWVLKETNSETALALLSEWADKEMVIIAPALLAYEVSNALYQHVRSGTLPGEDAERGLKEMIFPAIGFDVSQKPDHNIRAMQLARQFGLPAAYDAHFLELAERKGCELWTDDIQMWRTVQGKLDWVRYMSDDHLR